MAGVQSAVEQQVLTVAKAIEHHLDDEISKLEKIDEDDLQMLRERRLQQMKVMAEKRQHWQALGHGEYREIFNEKEFFSIAKASERVVCHFFRENWPCKVMDKHLDILARQHMECRFVKLNAEKSPFLTERLKIFMLPTLALVKKGKVEDYIVGFDELGGTDDFSTDALEDRLFKADIIMLDGESSNRAIKKETKRSVRQKANDDSDSE